jgi:hypothetical protein
VGDVDPPGPDLVEGQGIRTRGPASRAVLVFPDGARVALEGDAVLRDVSVLRGKRVGLQSGGFVFDVPRQPQPFLVSTPHAEVAVLGTRFSVRCGAESTRIEVQEGRVRVTKPDRASVEVKPGYFAVAGPGELAARPLPIDRIHLAVAEAVVAGQDWRAVRDPDAPAGAYEATRAAIRHPRPPGRLPAVSHLLFTFQADVDRDYFVWVRGRALVPNDLTKDAVILDFGDALASERPGVNAGKTGGLERALFNGWSNRPGWWWIGGDADAPNDEPPLTVRFFKPGLQTIRLYATETPVRVDAVLLSTSQKTRP